MSSREPLAPHPEPDEVSRRVRLARSFNTEQALSLPRPRTRGWFHLAAAVVSVPGAVVWIVTVTPGARLGVAAFALGVATMFTCSALLHRRRWTAHIYERLFRLDHTGIFLAIGGTGLGLALLGFEGTPAAVVGVTSVAGAAIGIAAEWLPFAPPRGLANAVYLTLGWSPVLLLPWLWSSAGAATVVLLLAGGVLYTVGAVVVGLRRPDPAPEVFGYHELFHLLVIAAAVVHAVMIGDLAARSG